MPVYRFQILDHRPVTPPVEAQLAGPEAAQDEAVRFAAEMLRDYPRLFWADGAWSVEVSDANGKELFRLQLLATAATEGRS
jgi:hypothetical protein